MKGGYLQDKYIYGSEYYNFFQHFYWNIINIFIYFSHNLITIPPISWINVCHKHNVKILGTFITEWDSGAEISNQLFQSKETAKHFAIQLINIMLKYQFDGWLINIENILNINNIQILYYFLNYLKKESIKLYKFAEIIW